MLLIVFASGCASKSDYQQLSLENKQLKNDMALFKEAYNPGLQKLFSENVLAAEKYRKSIEKTKNDIDYITGSIDKLFRESENDRMLISENLRTSVSQNVVNEFRQLNIAWNSTIIELSNLVRNSEKAAESSHRAALQAAEKAGSAERSAGYVAEYRDLINEQARTLNRIQETLKNLDIKIRKISKRLDKIDAPEREKGKEKADHKK